MAAKHLDITRKNRTHAEASALDEKILRSGLCRNCRHWAECVHLANARSPITACELHECEPGAGPRMKMYREKTGTPTVAGPRQNNHIGLCVNCDNRNTCRLPKPLGGIWHCEEYC